MNIKFYYIKGINKTDTMRFDNESLQQSYFENHIVQQYEDNAFYPPHYSFDLKVDTEDITLNTTVNYLSLYYNNKYYYYFINNITYLNENIISISLEMDTIQTYMFNMTRIYGLVERQSIERWNGNKINRDYIREDFSLTGNISSETWKEIKSPNYSNIALVLTQFMPVDADWTPYSSKGKNGLVYMGCKYLCTFIRTPNYTGQVYTKIKIGDQEVINSNVAKIGKSSYATKQFYIPDISYLGISWKVNDYTLILSSNSYITFDYETYDDKIYAFIGGQCLDKGISNSLIDFGFYKNKNKKSTFNYKLVPAMVDSFYIKTFVGVKGDMQQVSIENLDYSSFTPYVNIDATSGKVMIGINTFDYNYNFFYVSNIEPSIEITSDPYIEYTSRNSSMMQLKNIIGVQQIAMGIGTMNLGGFKTSDTSKYSDYAWRGKGHKSNYYTNHSISYSPNLKSSNQILEGINQLAENKAIIDDLIKSPNTIKSTGLATSMIAYDGMTPYVYYYVVKDYYLCAVKMERLGYRVNKYITYTNLSKFNVRYYYNVIQYGDDVNVELNILQDNTTIENIKWRLRNGLRLWNVNNDNVEMQDYFYDNVENSYLS